MRRWRLQPTVRPSDQVLIVGQNGSGKSVFARWMFDTVQSQKVCINVKRDPDLTEYLQGRYGEDCAVVDADLGKFDRAIVKRRVIVYEPASAYDQGEYHDLYQRIARRRNVTLWLDEAYGPTTAASFPTGIGTVLQHGRARNLRHLACSQRPVNVAKPLLTESHHIVVFPRGLSAHDTDTIAREMGLTRRRFEQIAAPLVRDTDTFGRFGHVWYDKRDNRLHLRDSLRYG